MIECEETWQLALQPWHVVCLKDHRLFAKCHTNFQKLVDPYVLPGWEGTALDSRIIKSASTRNDNLEIPQGKLNSNMH